MAGRMVVAVVLAGVCVAGRTACAGETQDVTVTVHVEDYAHIAAQDWARVRQMVGQIFAGGRVTVRWAGALHVPKQDWPRDGLSRVAVVITNIEAPFGGSPSDTADVLGRAAPEYSRAWVFANRIAAAAATGTVDRTVLLARVVAHEIGHLLLPGEGHSDRGIMTCGMALTQVGVFGFTPQQAASMHQRIRNDRRVGTLRTGRVPFEQ